MFWWPLDIENLRKIFFEEVFIFTIHNPASLLAKLEAAGFSVSVDTATQEYEVQISDRGYTLRVEHFTYFLRLIQQNLFTEEKIIELLARFVQQTDALISEDGSRRVRIELYLSQLLWR